MHLSFALMNSNILLSPKPVIFIVLLQLSNIPETFSSEFSVVVRNAYRSYFQDTLRRAGANDTIPVSPAAASGNQGMISGVVKDEKGQPMPGASVMVRGATKGTVTDVNGGFRLAVTDARNVIIVRVIGYATRQVTVGNQKVLNITLNPSSQSLSQVVVTGYTSQQKKDLTGAVSLIRSDEISSLPVGGTDQIIQGKAAGVSVTQTSGAPGEGISVRVRGVGSINNNDPLYVIDGVPTRGGINQISPNDIESINILKDAASASIYGARASNGVVVVTTKKGRSGKPRFNLNQYTGVQTHGDLIKMANTAQYVNAFNLAAAADGRDIIPAGLAASLPDVNWQKEVLEQAIINNTSLSVNGGGEGSNYLVSANYFKQDGLIRNSSFDRFNLKTSLNSRLTKIFNTGTNVNLSYGKTRQVGSSGDGFGNGNPGASVIRYALFRTPATPVYNSNGDFVDLPENSGFFGDGLNPVAYADNFDRNFKTYSALGNLFLEANILENLKLRTDFGGNLVITDFDQFFRTWGIDRFQNSPNSLARSNTTQFDYNWTNTLNYNLKFGEGHSFTVLAGTEAIKSAVTGLSASRTNFTGQEEEFQYLDNGLGIQQNGGNESRWALFSLFGRLGYQYNDKYLFSFNYRRDGSSRLSRQNRYDDFFSGSAGWRLDQENFLKDFKQLSMLKLRFSIGQTGNQEIGNYPYATLLYGAGYYPFGGSSAIGNTIVSRGNPDIKWEKSTQTDVGLDFGMFGNRIQLTADYFVKNTSDMLFQTALPSSAGGAAAPFVNAGKIRNRGLELELSYRGAAGKDWEYELSGNMATLENKVISLANDSPISGGRIDENYYATLTTAGTSVGEFYLLQMDGIFQNELDVFTHAWQGNGVLPGDVKYKDISGPGGVPDGIIDENDRIFAGSPIPKITYGLTGNLKYKNFDLNLFFQGASGNKIYNQVRTDIEGFYRAFNITERVATESWNGEGSSNEFPRLSWNAATNNKRPSTRFLEDGSYLRLKNVQIGYTLNSKMLERLKISSLRLYASGQNLLTFTKYTGLDPEMYTNNNSMGDGVRAVGIDWGTYPSARTYTLGLNVNF